ncbi:2-amino-4-hydroxy-6-hydroxymethyldihydropteridine diphosphokinase [Microbulbifer rhizosphaerae]|uniref:2-amino-4-hydroxy-6-hydroxymethyldihydropteridine pyrophosphokinase n=1 Tax=Microbulbifer rhizosphaerae TaxID=1562603 RepID=A0A7W4Z7D0_9GAMM|nr:2-amino-4-hydroxy-6-hydroxymethyldihydropteridine diphosphokinase [Microbulbifer rhizosphaerae]MBB3059608.1 2-amino-4-hydroxy-6-hydroxymethyldihydropteridine diphosphokinase [Microbulbifer rhizosphaerae]
MTRCFIGLGSNLTDPQQQLRSALDAIAALPQTTLLRCSSFYLSAPVGPGNQPDYINAVAELETRLEPLELLDGLQAIESAQGRERGIRWGARTLDLDILLFGQQHIDEPRLQVPHPRMVERNFVLLPLAELEPELQLPSGASIQTLLLQCPHNRLEKL